MTRQYVTTRLDRGVALITWQRDPVNALCESLAEQLDEAIAAAEDAPEAACIVIAGGQRVFAAGADIAELKDLAVAGAATQAKALGRAVGRLASSGKPTIAAISGFALGGGLEIALAADFRVADETAKLGLPEVKLGLIPGAGGTQRLPRLVGRSVAKELILTGRTVRAHEAVTMGLVNRVVPAGQAESAATEWALEFVTSAPLALQAAKAAIDGGLDASLAVGLELERGLFTGLFGTEDAHAGMAAFMHDGAGSAVAFQGR